MNDTPKRAYNEGRLEDARRLLLKEYAEKKVVRLVQVDAFADGGLCGGEEYELRNLAGTPTIPVRVQVYERADKEEVLALLRKITDWVESAWDESLSRAGQERFEKELNKMLGEDGPFDDPERRHLRRIK